MLLAPLRWLAKNFSSLLLAFVLAMVVWVSAVVTADPNEEHLYKPVELEMVGKDADLMVIGEVPTQVRITLQAPRSIWTRLNNTSNLVEAWVDLSGLGAGEHTVPIRVRVNTSPVRVVLVEPDELRVALEPIVSRTFPVQLKVQGDPPLGYRKGVSTFSPSEVTVSGPASILSQVDSVQAVLAVNNASETIRESVPLQAFDAEENPIANISILPKTIEVTQPINLLGGFKNVVVKVLTTGQVANGYRLTNISVTPPNVTVFSSNPQLVNELPGYVETLPVNLDGLNDDIDIRVTLKLPDGISLVGEQSVLVQVGVAAIEGSLTISLPVEALGLAPELAAQISPATVDVIVSGPLPILDALTPASFRVVIDLSGYNSGTYQLTPVVDLAPDQVRITAILPETVEVTIAPATTPTAGAPTAISGESSTTP